jgi:hypothetical protein
MAAAAAGTLGEAKLFDWVRCAGYGSGKTDVEASEEKRSFLKKRTKKLLSFWSRVSRSERRPSPSKRRTKSFLLLFLPSLPALTFRKGEWTMTDPPPARSRRRF